MHKGMHIVIRVDIEMRENWKKYAKSWCMVSGLAFEGVDCTLLSEWILKWEKLEKEFKEVVHGFWTSV